LAIAIRKRYGIQVKLIESSKGAFEVRKDRKLIFSKKAMGRFPEESEILEKIGE
jgi:selT/selW/selH-like putative selenoprotein